MAGKSGGTATAHGVGYQHLIVVEEVLGRLEKRDIEWSLFLESANDDVIDYGFRDPHGLARVVQAKSSVDGPAGRSVSATEAVRIFERMVRGAKAEAYVLRTNRPVASALASLNTELGLLRQWHASSPHLATAVQDALQRSGATPSIEFESDQILQRVALCRIEADGWRLPEICEQLSRRIRVLRRARGWAAGEESAEILVNHIAMRLLKSSATAPGSELSVTQIERMFFPADRVVAQARGAYDWGRVAGPIPNTDAVPRPEPMNFLERALAGTPSRQPRKLVLTGFSGAGKSTVAASFARRFGGSYDRIIWIDAHDVSTIRQTVYPRVMPLYDGGEDRSLGTTSRELQEAFREMFHDSAESWLLIFDNARSAVDIRAWCPTQGHVDLIATSNDSVSWSGWTMLKIEHLPREISVALIEKRMGITSPNAESIDNANLLAEQLDDWPLTLELACAYLSASGRGLDSASSYLKLLMSKIVDDDLLTPDSYRSHRTLLRAVLVALEGLASRELATQTIEVNRYQLARMALDAMAYLPGRSAHAELAVSAGLRLDPLLSELPTVMPVDDVALSLAEFSLASRVTFGASTPSIFRVNEAVLHVVRQRHSVEQRAAVLETVVESAHEYVKSAVDDRRRTDGELIIPSATSALQWLIDLEYPSGYGALLAGNLAVLWGALSHPEISLEYYDLELRLLEVMGQDAPRLRAKIHTSVSTARLRLEMPTSEILDAINTAMTNLEGWPVDQDADGRVEVVYQLERVLSVLSRNPREDVDDIVVIDSIHHAIRKQLADTGNAAFVDLQRACTLLDIAGEESEALALIDKVLSGTTSPNYVRQEALSLRVEALVYLKRLEEAGHAADLAFETAQRAFGIEEVADSLINAWMEVLRYRFAPHGPPTRSLVQKFEAMFSNVELARANSQSRLDACRFASGAPGGDPDGELKEIEARLDGEPFPESKGVRSEAPTKALIAASSRFMAIRRSNQNASIVRGLGWARVTESGRAALLLMVDDDDAELLIGQPSEANGEWLIEEDAVILAIGGQPALLVSFPFSQMGWIRLEGDSLAEKRQPATVRLAELLRTAAFVEAARCVFVTVASGSGASLLVLAHEPDFPGTRRTSSG